MGYVHVYKLWLLAFKPLKHTISFSSVHSGVRGTGTNEMRIDDDVGMELELVNVIISERIMLPIG